MEWIFGSFDFASIHTHKYRCVLTASALREYKRYSYIGCCLCPTLDLVVLA